MAFFRKTVSDSELVKGILEGGNRQRFFENQLYSRYAYLIREGVRKHRLTEDECSMAFSDTVLTVIENIQKGRFEGRAELKTYLYQIFTNKCVDLIRKNATNKQQVNRGVGIDDYMNILPDESRSVVERLMEQYDIDLLHRRMQELGEKCKQMILAWGEGFMDQEIAVKMGYQSAAVVKTSRLRCLEKLRAIYKTQN
ncbi:hypothetical protein DYBT9275_04551 [Dyadobacter sp. CECT 9275]|uniref:Sigma-70 family RNA polymerase sigma factor n=1 Tax=Dyadobacter helix TaxID=2822344 RepID=A0A916N7N4_9BACT|nr:sigma-70 family RNA polymerase sigma factor [Dyadobacter sp. CECT 9275]CAG5009692.1 hypothetical protein DYBT9275_04551 [Dyadobacter sp. CECT 9275]